MPPGPVRSERALAGLTVAASGPRTGYSRERFGDWATVADHCDTRELVLQRDGSRVVVDRACRATSGRWRSSYDGKLVRDSGKLDIDDMVPLANAWISGARAWTPERRDAFANDLRDPQLIAVSVLAPLQGRPLAGGVEAAAARGVVPVCALVVAVKQTWKLTITAAERDALAGMLATR